MKNYVFRYSLMVQDMAGGGINPDLSACKIYKEIDGRNSGVLKRGIDSTLNPIDCLWVKASSPDFQSFHSSGYNTVENRKPKSL